MLVAAPAYHFSPFAIPPAVTAAVVMLFAVRVVVTRYSRISLAIFAMSVTAAVWQTAFAFMYLSTDTHTARTWARIGYGFVPFMAPAVYMFVTNLLHVSEQRKVASWLGWFVAAQFAILTITTDYLVTGVQRYWWGFYPAYDFAASVPYLVFFGGFLIASVVEIVRAYPRSAGTERQRIRLFTVALGIGYLAVVDYLPVYHIGIYPFGWAALLGYTAVAVYTVRRHGLLPISASLAAKEIIGTMRDLLLVADRDGRIQFANNAAYAFLGCTKEDIIGRPLEELMIPAEGSGEPLLQGRWVKDREYIFRTRTGQPIELTLSYSPVTDQDEVTGAVLIARDLRERKRYEWEARRAVTLLQSTLDSTTDGILVIGQEGRILTWNQRFADIWGIPAELMEQYEEHELIDKLASQLVRPEDFRRTLDALHGHPQMESFHTLEFRDGRRYEQYSIGRELGNSPLRVWSFHDVTARLAAEEALRESEERYRLLFEQNAAGVCVGTLAGQIVDCNATFSEMVGYSASELKNRPLQSVFDREGASEEMRVRLESRPTLRGIEIELRRRDGRAVPSLANVSLLGRGARTLVHMTAVDISDRKRAEEQIAFHAYHDALTQLPNRRLFVDRLELSILTAKRARGNVAVLFIDLDRFKGVNDTFGHAVADQLLVEMSERLRGCVRQTDTVARLGGDEFTMILPDLHQPEDAARVAEKILEAVAAPALVGQATIEISASVGVAVYPYDGTDSDTLLRNADDAMYRAKDSGRNTYQLCTEQMKTRAVERLAMQSRLQKAMADGELVLAYEPQVSMTTGLPTGAEVLIRWNDPQRGAVEPHEFISAAEDTSLIVTLGEWTLAAACRQLRQWIDEGVPPLRLSVNIASRQFQQRDFASVVQRTIEASAIKPSLLELQIGEKTAMHHVDVTVETLNSLREVGVSIAIDDFGSDYSSLRYLQVLPIDTVKIDRRCIAGVITSASDAAVAGAIVDVSRTLNLRVVAEGAATDEQIDFLQRRHCPEAQGPFFGPPLDAADYARLLQNPRPLPVISVN